MKRSVQFGSCGWVGAGRRSRIPSDQWTAGCRWRRGVTAEATVRPPLPDEAEGLDTGSGVSLLVLRKVSIDTTDRVVEVSDVLMPGDRTELIYTTNLTRWKP